MVAGLMESGYYALRSKLLDFGAAGAAIWERKP